MALLSKNLLRNKVPEWVKISVDHLTKKNEDGTNIINNGWRRIYLKKARDDPDFLVAALAAREARRVEAVEKARAAAREAEHARIKAAIKLAVDAALTAARADVSADDVERKARLPGGRTALAAFRKRSACADVACAGRRVRRWCAKALPLQQRMRRSWPRRLRRWLQVTQVSRSTSSAVAGQSVRWSTCCCICRRRSCRKNTARVAPGAQSGPRRPLRLRLRRRKTLPS
jgi:hypothetical protein